MSYEFTVSVIMPVYNESKYCVGIVNIVKTKNTTNPKLTFRLIICVALFFILLTAFRLYLSYNI